MRFGRTGARAAALTLAAAVAVSGAVAATHVVLAPTAGAAAKPNIVVIEIDDMRYDEMPYMTKTLAALPGTSFTRSVVSTSLCCPSRAAFLSGQYVTNNRVFNNNSYLNFNHNNTLATWLTSAGYHTAELGKYMNGYTCTRARPAGWSHWQALCQNVYNMFGYTLNDNGTLVTYGKAAADYQTDVLAGRAEATLDEGFASGKPTFMWLTPTAPHSGTGSKVAPRYATAYANYTLPQAANFNEADVSDKPAWVRSIPKMTASKVSSIKKSERVRLQMLLAVDDMIERVVNKVKAAGQFENTYFIVTSDNGFMRGEHRVPLGKEVIYRDSVAVPLLISGPGVPTGTNNALVLNTDLAPTIQEWASATSARVQDGRSLVQAITNPASFDGRVAYHTAVADSSKPAHPGGIAVTADQFTYTLWDTLEQELYDHTVDPLELNNLATAPKFAPVLAQLQALANVAKTCNGSGCLLSRGNLPPSASMTPNCQTATPTCDVTAAASYDVDGSIAQYSWNFGDGQTATGLTAHHVYSVAGTYTITLTVTDDDGTSRTATATVDAGTPNVPPTAAFSSSVTGTVVDVDGSASSDPDGSIVAYEWDFGGGNTASGPTASFDFLAPGSYPVTLTVTDDSGASDSVTQTVDVP